MGARLKTGPLIGRPRNGGSGIVSINILRDRRGGYYQLLTNPLRRFRVEALDVRPRDRHLLLMVAEQREAAEKQKFLCGHDEREWFVAAVPGASASNVITAMEALKPRGVQEAQAFSRVKAAHRNRRKNRAFVRQGEWFFIPCPTVNFPTHLVLRREPLQRSGGKAHWAEFAYRSGGETVYVNREHPQGLTVEQLSQLYGNAVGARRGFRVMQRNATVHVKGRISHPDHQTIALNCWHRVEMNTESQAPAMQHVAFLD